jgi:hypothetical protein
MNFLLTRYIYPLEAKSVLSERLNIFLDNPRTDEEITVIAEYLRYSESIDHAAYDHNWRLPRAEEVDVDYEVLTLDGIVHDFLERYASFDAFVEQFRNENQDSNIFIKLAKMWVIARYNDEGQIQALREEAVKLSEEGKHGFFLLDDDNPIVSNSKNLVNYSYLLSLLIHAEGEEYFGKTFLLHYSEYDIRSPKVDKWLNQHLVYFGFFAHSDQGHQDALNWLFYPPIKDELYKVVKTIDSVVDEVSREKILYVANLLGVAGNEVNDEKVMLMFSLA